MVGAGTTAPLELDEELLELDEELLELDEELLELELDDVEGSGVTSPPQATKNTLLASASNKVLITASPQCPFYSGFLRWKPIASDQAGAGEP